MKPINNLSVLGSPSFPLETKSAENPGGNGISALSDHEHERPNRHIDQKPSNMNPNQSAIESTSSSPADLLPDKTVQDKNDLCSKETPLSVLKILPLTHFIHNKVSSSFQTPQQMTYNSLAGLSSFVLPATNRKVRDSGSLLFMLAFLGFLAYMIWDGIVVKEADINLIVHGHDSYGNICGRNNRPIKFVEKSGQNYEKKPYTKYTLINAQFERYTLDSERLKKGELFYVRHNNSIETLSTDGGVSEGKLFINRRVRRATPELSSQHKQFTKNQTLLKQLKSTLMYNYPPLYGYNNIQTKTASNEMSQSMKNFRASQEAQMETSASNIDHRFVSGVDSPSTNNRVSMRTTQNGVLFDDSANDSDRFDHMLVTPTSNQVTRGPNVLNQNEVSSQLLYLTECVDVCPADHVELIFYRCMPKNWRFSLFPNAINVTRTFIDDILTDMSHCYRELIYIFSFALFLSLALLILLRFLASFIIWSCLALLVSLLLSIASYSWFNYYHQVVDLNGLMPHDSVYSDRLISSDKWLIGAIFLTFVAFGALATVIFMRRRILLVTKLFSESGKAISDMPLLLLQPVLTFAALLAITIIWSIGLICLQSVKVPVIDVRTGFVVFKTEMLHKVMRWYHIFAFLWVSHFAIACQHYVIGAAVSKWYFTTDRYNLNSPIGSSVSELMLFYLGSVALGSFLVAIFKVIRIVTRQIRYLVQRNCISHPTQEEEARQMSDSALNPTSLPSSCCSSFAYVGRMFVWFFDNIVMIINRDAYVEIGIHGHSFITGAKRAFTVLASNPLKLLAIKSVSTVLLAIAKISVVFGTISMAIILTEEKTNQLNYSWSPIVVSALYAYIVAHWFLSVYEMVIDALFICYCEDYERSKNQQAEHDVIRGSNFMSRILNNDQGVIY